MKNLNMQYCATMFNMSESVSVVVAVAVVRFLTFLFKLPFPDNIANFLNDHNKPFIYFIAL